MHVRCQVSMVFHLDKCIGCHTCSLACKNLWTGRPGTEYMWWNNVETKPGTGYPTLYEDQDEYRGGWELHGSDLRLKLNTRAGELLNLAFNPKLPSLDDYYEPWTYKYSDVTEAPQGREQPVFAPISLVTGKEMQIEAGPNWDDDLGGSSFMPPTTRISKRSATRSGNSCSKPSKSFSFICRACAITASTPVAWQPAPPAQSTSAVKMESYW